MHLVCIRKREKETVSTLLLWSEYRAFKRVQVGAGFMLIKHITADYNQFPVPCPLQDNIPVLQPDGLLGILQKQPLWGCLDWGQRLTLYRCFQNFVGLLNTNMFLMSLWLFKCKNQPVTGAPQLSQTTPKWFRNQPEKKSKKKKCFWTAGQSGNMV